MELYEMRGNRNDFWADRAVDFWSVATRVYDVKYSGCENIPSVGPALILPKHQYLLDIPLEGLLLRNSGRYGNWVMKDSLSGWLDCLGAIRYMRPDDVKKRVEKNKPRWKLEAEERGEDVSSYVRKMRRGLIEEMKEFNATSNEYSKWLYGQDEIIVSHPEGTRVRGKLGKMWSDFVDVTRNFSNESGVEIPVIPVGIEYMRRSGVSLRSKIYVRVGERLDINSDDLMGVVGDEMTRSSGLS
jgi:1-acyl-sn-glycerol-3-phosphate acyltransferase